MVALDWFKFAPYYSPSKFVGNQLPEKTAPDCYYCLPYLKLRENQWSSYCVEGMAWLVYGVSVYGVLFPICIVGQSIYMIPLHVYGLPMMIYRNSYETFVYLDRLLP